MLRISRLHPLCVAIIPLKKYMPFEVSGRYALGLNIIIIIPFSPLRAKAPLTHKALNQVIGSFSQATSEDRHIRDATACVLFQFRGAY